MPPPLGAGVGAAGGGALLVCGLLDPPKPAGEPQNVNPPEVPPPSDPAAAVFVAGGALGAAVACVLLRL